MNKHFRINSEAPKLKNLFAFLIFMFVFAAAAPIFAQQESGQVNGTVKDQNDAAIPGAVVIVKNTATNATRTVTTDDQGNYLVTNLQPGTYEISATKDGFQEARENIQITVGGRLTVSLTAGVQNATAVVDVTSAGDAQINTTDQQISTTVTGKQIQELPILNRNPYSLIGLSGNVSETDPSGRGAGVAINGLRAASTNILLDGAENNDIFRAAIAQTTPLESVGEFQVITSNFSAEFGRASGGIVNVSTRAGSNRFQGNVFAFNRNSALAANTFGNNANDIDRPNFNRNQFGYFLSGPIVKDKLFFSNSTEWTIIRSSASVLGYVPTESFINSANVNTRNFFAAYGRLKSTLTPIGAPVAIGSATPNFQLVSDVAPIDAGGGTPQDSYSTVTRIDWNISDNTQLYGRYAQERPKFLQGTFANSAYEGFDIGQSSLNNSMLLNLAHNFSGNLISNTKASFRRSKLTFSLANSPDIPTLYFFQNVGASFDGNPIVLPGYMPTAPGAGIPGDETQSLFQINQDITYLAGSHSFKFGGQYINIRDNNTFPAFQNASLTLGTTLANAVANLTGGSLTRLQVAIDPQGRYPGQTLNLPVSYPSFTRINRYNEGALYVNDTWRVVPRLNLNLGMRYEYYSVQRSEEEQDSNFYFGSGNNIFEQIRNGAVGVASENGGLWRPDKNNFAPRVGFAWDVFGDGRTSLRGGYGIAYERNFGNVTFNVIQNPPFYATLQLNGPLPIPTSSFGPLAGSSGTATLPRSSLRYVRNDIKNAYAHLYSLAMEREIFQGTTVRAEFSGSAGRDLYSIENINRRGTGTAYLGSDGAAGCPSGLTPENPPRLNCQYGDINTRGNNGYSNFNGLTLSVVSNNLLDTGLAFTARYTYAVAKDNLSSTFSESGNNFNLGLTDPFNPEYDYGYADFDVRHRFVSSFNYDLPFARNLSGAAKTLLDGFSINGILTARTGSPFTIFDCTNASFTTCIRIKPTTALALSNAKPTDEGGNVFTYLDLSDQLPNSFTDGFSGGTEVGFPTDVTRRNAFRGLGSWNFDLGFLKNFRFSERYGLQIRADLINAFNLTDFVIDGASADLSGGAVRAFKTGSGPGGTQRTIQLSAKFIF